MDLIFPDNKYEVLTEIEVTEVEVLEQTANLKCNKSPDPDGVRVLKELKYEEVERFKKMF